MNIFWLFITLCFYAMINAAMDYTNFALGTGDFWHLLKYFDRLSLFLSGFIFAKIPKEEKNAFPCWIWIIIIIISLLLLKFIIWDTVYYTLRDTITWLHNHCHISTGIDFLDKFLGFHQP